MESANFKPSLDSSEPWRASWTGRGWPSRWKWRATMAVPRQCCSKGNGGMPTGSLNITPDTPSPQPSTHWLQKYAKHLYCHYKIRSLDLWTPSHLCYSGGKNLHQGQGTGARLLLGSHKPQAKMRQPSLPFFVLSYLQSNKFWLVIHQYF